MYAIRINLKNFSFEKAGKDEKTDPFRTENDWNEMQNAIEVCIQILMAPFGEVKHVDQVEIKKPESRQDYHIINHKIWRNFKRRKRLPSE